MIVRAKIPRKIRSRNEFMRGSKWKYINEKKAWLHNMHYILGSPSSPPIGMAYCLIESVRGRLLDEDNLIGGAKPIPDCLKQLGFIKDDRPGTFKCKYVQRLKNKGEKEHTIITFSDQPLGETA